MADAPVLMEAEEEAAYELRCAEGALWTSSRLFMAIVIMAFAGEAFGYFYLRSTNSFGMWRPGGMTAPTLLGTIIAAAVVGGAIINSVGFSRLRRGSDADWVVAGVASAFLGALGLGLQIWQLTRLSFYPGASGYSSVFIAWAGMNIAMCFAGFYWTETLVARALRIGKLVADDGGLGLSDLPPARLFRANLEGASYFWWLMAVVSVVFWLLFYII